MIPKELEAKAGKMDSDPHLWMATTGVLRPSLMLFVETAEYFPFQSMANCMESDGKRRVG